MMTGRAGPRQFRRSDGARLVLAAVLNPLGRAPMLFVNERLRLTIVHVAKPPRPQASRLIINGCRAKLLGMK